MRLPEVGDIFGERFRIDALLGRGGFATVFAAHDTRNHRQVALKLLRPDDGSAYDPRTRARFQREVAIVATLSSPHTVALLDSGEADGLLYMAFEMLGGEDLAELIEQRGRLAPAEVEDIMRQVLASLSEAHERGLLHRDLKPENIRVVDRGGRWHVTLLDFGLARATGRESPQITSTGELVGTPRYMAPEQLVERPLTPAVDIYALGVVAFELLMGRDTLHGSTWADQLERLRTGHVFSIPDLDLVGARLARLLTRMTSRNAADRPQTARAALTALDAPDTMDTMDTSVERAPMPSPAPSGRLRAFAIVLVIGCACLAVVALMLSRQPEDADEMPRGLIAKQPGGLIASPTPSEERVEAAEEMDAAVADIVSMHEGSPGCGKPPPFAGLDDLHVTIGIRRDAWLTYIPKSYDARRPVPVVVLLHQTAEPPTQLLPHTGFEALAERDGWILVMPTDVPERPWTTSASLDRVADVVQFTSEELCVDPGRVFLVGQGQGGRAAEQLSCEPWVRAIATNSFRSAVDEDYCPDVPKPSVMFSPLDSAREPVEGGDYDCEVALTGSDKAMKSLEHAEEKIRERNGCGPDRQVSEYDPRCFTWTCEAPFVSCHVPGGHGWPGAPPRQYGGGAVKDIAKRFLADCDGVPGDFPTGEVIWSFFKNLPEHDAE